MMIPYTIAEFELPGAIDGAAVEALRRDVRTLAVAPQHLRVSCDRVGSIDPVGAALLWLLCHNLEDSAGTRIRLDGLRVDLIHRLNSHPLRQFVAVDEELFSDPFGSRPPSAR